MVRGGVLLVGQGMVVNNTLQLKLFRRKGIHYTYIQYSYTQLPRVKNFSSICLYCYYFGFPCGVLCRGGVWGGGGLAGGPGPGEKMVVQQTLNLY